MQRLARFDVSQDSGLQLHLDGMPMDGRSLASVRSLRLEDIFICSIKSKLCTLTKHKPGFNLISTVLSLRSVCFFQTFSHIYVLAFLVQIVCFLLHTALNYFSVVPVSFYYQRVSRIILVANNDCG